MLLMTWPMARMGSRFGLLFEPHKRQVMHSALGRFFDQPVDLAVGLIEEDGTKRVLPFTPRHKQLYACEQNERINSITWRAHDESLGLRFEFNIHNVFYPRNEKLCRIPAYYLEVRVVWVDRVRWRFHRTQALEKVRLFISIKRPDTRISVAPGRIDLAYETPLTPQYQSYDVQPSEHDEYAAATPVARVQERIVSINEDAVPYDDDGVPGLTLELPVTEEGQGIKWRLVWGAYTGDPVLTVHDKPARFRYTEDWPDLDAVMEHAIARRSDYLQRSRWLEKILEQAPLTRARWHLTVLGFQSYLSNTFWCTVEGGQEWFSTTEGVRLLQSPVDSEYNQCLFYLAVWPRLLGLMLEQWTLHATAHQPSNGAILHHDLGQGLNIGRQSHHHMMPVEENANYLLMLQAYVHWTGDRQLLERHVDFVQKLADYLVWTDVDDTGFPSEGTANTQEDGSVVIRFARKQTYLAIKRVAALEAASDLMILAGRIDDAPRYGDTAARAVPRIESRAWLGDHFAISVDGVNELSTDTSDMLELPLEQPKGWDAYSIYTMNGLLLPAMTGQPMAFESRRLVADLVNAMRETQTPYGCSQTSVDSANICISQNLWRDLTAQYLRIGAADMAGRYWDLLAFSNTAGQSFGYIDTYIGNELAFDPRGVTAFGYFLAGPRLTIDRLTLNRLGNEHIAVRPDRHKAQRWPLLPLADWDGGKFPILVVDMDGNAYIEAEISPVTIQGDTPEGMIG